MNVKFDGDASLKAWSITVSQPVTAVTKLNQEKSIHEDTMTEACNCLSELGHRRANYIFINYTSLKSHQNYILKKNVMQP